MAETCKRDDEASKKMGKLMKKMGIPKGSSKRKMYVKDDELNKMIKELDTVNYTLKTVNQEKTLPISKVSCAKLSKDKEFIYFDKLNDGTWRMVYTKGTFEEFNDV